MVVKLNERKIWYIVREKIKNRSNKRIAAEMNVSVSTVKRVWRRYLRTKELISNLSQNIQLPSMDMIKHLDPQCMVGHHVTASGRMVSRRLHR